MTSYTFQNQLILNKSILILSNMKPIYKIFYLGLKINMFYYITFDLF